MPTDKQCPICQSQLRVQPAGNSKTSGKPYPAFYSCPKRCNIRGLIDTRVDQVSPWDPKGFFPNKNTQAIPAVEAGTTPLITKVDCSPVLAEEISLLRKDIGELSKFLHEQLGGE